MLCHIPLITDELYHATVVSIYKLTASSLITSISAVTSSVTAIRGVDTLTIGAPKCSTLTRSCTNCNTDVKMFNAWEPKLYSLVSSLPHPISSLPFVQCWVPSQWREEGIHWPLLHWTAPLWQEAVQIVPKFCCHSSYATNLQTFKTYCSLSHHFHQNIHWSSHCIEMCKGHTGCWNIETGWNHNLIKYRVCVCGACHS